MSGNLTVDILFVCTANRFRSVVAEGYFRFLCENAVPPIQVSIGSAGTWAVAGFPPVSEAAQFAREHGFLVDNIRSKEIDKELIENSRLVIAMASGHKESILLEYPWASHKVFQISQICRNQTFDVPDLGDNEGESATELLLEICGLLDEGFEKICNILSIAKKEQK